MNEVKYRVLWIDDQPELVEGYQWWAGLRDIQLVHRESWTDALPVLEKDFNNLTAVILDANCKYQTTDKELDEGFLIQVLRELDVMCEKHHRLIPWYILSAGTMTNFDFITNVLIKRKRHELETEWGQTVFMKDDFENQGENSPLFDCICHAGENQSCNLVLYRHSDTFKYLGEGSLISNEARKILLKALSVLYFPEENINYEFAGNPLRKVLEYLFRSAQTKGLLPNAFFKDGKPNLWDSMQYMCGKNPSNIKFRFGNVGETIFPERQSYLLLNILNFVNEESHTSEKDTFVIDTESKDLFFGFVLHLMNVIKCYGYYVEQHPDAEENMKKCMPISDKKAAPDPQETNHVIEFVRRVKPEEFIGQPFTVLQEKTFKYAGTCKISSEIKVNPGARITIHEIVPNSDKDKSQFPYIATKITIL